MVASTQAQLLRLTHGQHYRPPAHTGFDRVLLAPGNDQLPRTRPGERLHELFEYRCDRLRQHGYAHHLAVDDDQVPLTYAQLDEHANQLARYLLAQGARAGDRIALLFEQPVQYYIGMLAVSKIHAAYIPLDTNFPTDRITYITTDSHARLLLSVTTIRPQHPTLETQLRTNSTPVLWIDRAAGHIATLDPHRLTVTERGTPVEELAYIIYTSGSTGQPKGVAVGHPAICNFVRTAAACYGYNQHDRVYQGLTHAFDFAIEETWVPWMAGATLVPKPAGAHLLGEDLHQFLSTHAITALCCVPTLLATLEHDLPQLRLLLVSGEACPQDLITRWHRPDRRLLNLYGPTEATVTATWTTLHPNKPVTIGVPLPSYAIVVLDPDNPRHALPHGEIGEIGIAGIGLARGYLNRPEQTSAAFIPDFLHIPHNPSGRIYRTGDLGRVNNDGEIEYHGRKDLQVKIRGYRIELTEIESALLDIPGIAAAVVTTYQPDSTTTELAGYYTLRQDTPSLDDHTIHSQLQQQLPAYMIPTYLQQLPDIPLTPNNKADRKSLPPPTTQHRAHTTTDHTDPTSSTEQQLTNALGATLHLPNPSTTAHLFHDYNANSLTLAQFAAQARKQPSLPPISIKLIYQHPTIRDLAQTLDTHRVAKADTSATPTEPAASAGPPDLGDSAGLGGLVIPAQRHPKEPTTHPPRSTATTPAADSTPAPPGAPARASNLGYVLTGAAQLTMFIVFSTASGIILDRGYQYLTTATSLAQLYLYSLVFTSTTLAGWVALPIIAKWLLVGRWKPARFRLWGPAYLRWWTVKTLIRANPMALLTGSPLYVWYLRALGAKIGKNVAIFSRTIPIATDLIHIGDNTVIRRNCSFTGYRAIHGTIQTGTITLGRNATISDETVLDINTSMGDHAQLGHASSLSTGQHIPTGQTWHGTPAEPASPTANYQRIQTTHRTTIRKFVYTVLQLTILLLLVPVLTAAAIYLVTTVANLNNLETLGTHYLTTPTFYLAIAAVVALAYLALLILAILAILTIPHCARFLIKPGKTYPLYGIHHVAQQLITTLTNSQNLVLLLGDSAYITTFLRLLGYQMTPLIQTGSNFGTQHTHDSPHLTTIGTGTLVSDGLFAINAEFSNTSFRVDRVVIGGHNFLGNNIAFPAGARTGSNVLLATKVMVPTDGPIRENTGLLGSPPFEIPRTNPAHSKFEILDNPGLIRRQLTRKTRYNTRTLALIIAARTIQFIITAQAIAIAYVFYPQHHILATTAALLAMTLITAVYPLLAERAITGFRQLQPQHCTIYDPYFWKHERLWKFGTYPILPGTPFQNILWRLSGVHIGHRVFDDGSVIPEKTLVTIGDDAVLNAGVTIQNHSLEDGVFTSDRSTIGADTTIGTNAFVHLATTLADHTTLDAHAFLMKGSQTAPHTTWTGNPAEEAPQHTSPTHQRPGTPQTTNTSTNAHAAA